MMYDIIHHIISYMILSLRLIYHTWYHMMDIKQFVRHHTLLYSTIYDILCDI
jgi:hypothetical protein